MNHQLADRLTVHELRLLPADEPSPPPRLTRTEWRALPAAEQSTYDAARRTHHTHLVMPAPVIRQAVTRGRSLLTANRRADSGQRRFLEISGPACTGKSIAALELERALWRTDLVRNPVRGLDNRITTQSITAPPESDLRRIVLEIARALYPPEFVREDESLEELAAPPLHILNSQHTSMVIIDQAERIAPTAAAAHEALAWLTDRLPGTTFAYVVRATADGAQPTSVPGGPGRGLPTHVAARPVDYGPEWLDLVAAAEEQLLLLDQAPHNLTRLGLHLHESTGGLVGVLGPALRRAAADAVGTTEQVTWDALEHLLISTK